MSTLSDVIRAAEVGGMPSGIPYVAPVSARDAQTRGRARVADTQRDGNVVSRLLGWVRVAVAVVWSDLANAWVWRGQPPTLLDLWRARRPALDAVPGGSRALWIGWTVWNHFVLAVFAPLATVLWVLQHPARAGLAALVGAPIIAMWIF